MVKLQILGTNCPKCQKLAENTAEAARQAGLTSEVEKVTDITAIMSLGVMSLPALVVDGQIKAAGRLLEIEEIKALLPGRVA